MEQYFLAKELLMAKGRVCVVNADDMYGQRILKKYKSKSISFSLQSDSDFRVEDVACTMGGCKYTLLNKKEKLDIKTSLIGEFSVYNTALAIVCATELKIKEEYIINGVSDAKAIKGRLEKYKNTNIYIDYAHTPKAVKSVIEVIKQIEPGKRVISLFGCGGDRDKSKRPEMGRICTELCDLTIITSDNSRSENPNEILSDIIRGIGKSNRFMVIPDRREAIRYVAKGIGEQEILLLLGKGHEEYEITENGKISFSEKKILDEVLG
jgi:UDP-N-acetylmuramoyl-L-alanyl-D-glutamate--2,6-diaminopimelate ligase